MSEHWGHSSCAARIAELEAERDAWHEASSVFAALKALVELASKLETEIDTLRAERDKLAAELAGVRAGVAAMTEEWRAERGRLKELLKMAGPIGDMR